MAAISIGMDKNNAGCATSDVGTARNLFWLRSSKAVMASLRTMNT